MSKRINLTINSRSNIRREYIRTIEKKQSYLEGDQVIEKEIFCTVNNRWKMMDEIKTKWSCTSQRTREKNAKSQSVLDRTQSDQICPSMIKKKEEEEKLFTKAFFKSHGPLLFKSINSMRLSYSNTIRRQHCDYYYYFFLGSLSPSFVLFFFLSLSLCIPVQLIKEAKKKIDALSFFFSAGLSGWKKNINIIRTQTPN